ncbi:MAG: phosphoheptose isomerase [Ekhidna sp.]
MNRLFKIVNETLVNKGYQFERKDMNRPWGGFWVIDNNHSQQFVEEYFPNLREDDLQKEAMISPKILAVSPNSRLSWQYHHRRSEIWQVVSGEVGVIISDSNEETTMKVYQSGELIYINQGERHRLVGLKKAGIVAEIWVHEDVNNPSDEDDIVRLQDDFERA